MGTPLIPQEIYLLERYSSLDYFGEMRDAWAKMIEVAEEALGLFVLKLPPDYRSRHLSHQPDIVWGERILPNFRATLESLDGGYIMLSHGDLSALAFGGNVQSAIKGQTGDFPSNWMPKEFEDQFSKWQAEAGIRGRNLSISEYAGWVKTDLSNGYHEDRGPLNAPATFPIYRVNPSVSVRTGQEVSRTGIYLPTCEDSCAQILIQGYEAFRARIGYDPVTTHQVSKVDTTWTLVERIADIGGGLSSYADPMKSELRLRCEATHPCPCGGFWFTPAQAGSRRHFSVGEVMPDIGGDYGTTIWQWDDQQ